jgi:hypothetical protein
VAVSATLFALSLMAAVTVPIVRQRLLEERAAAVVADLRSFTAALKSLAHERGEWPAPTAAPGEIPAGAPAAAFGNAWSRPSPIGGVYTWAPDSLHRGVRCRAALIISSVGPNRVSTDRRQLAEIDRRIDDGDLATGRFRLGYRHQPVFVLEY